MSTRDEIEAAAARLDHHVRATPILPLDESELGACVTLKLEYLQHSGSFKARGAFNRLLTLDVPAAGVAAASGGNHGAAVAYAAHKLGIAATVFVPGPTPPAKLDRIRGYGATVIQEGAAYADALAACQAHQARTGAVGVHAYDDPAVLAGQGTVAREFAARRARPDPYPGRGRRRRPGRRHRRVVRGHGDARSSASSRRVARRCTRRCKPGGRCRSRSAAWRWTASAPASPGR